MQISLGNSLLKILKWFQTAILTQTKPNIVYIPLYGLDSTFSSSLSSSHSLPCSPHPTFKLFKCAFTVSQNKAFVYTTSLFHSFSNIHLLPIIIYKHIFILQRSSQIQLCQKYFPSWPYLYPQIYTPQV